MPNHYIANSTDTFIPIGDYITAGSAMYTNPNFSVETKVDSEKGKISPQLFFKFTKKKFGVLEKMKLDSRIKKLEKAFYIAIENGQEALGKKLMTEVVRETKETLIYAKGIKFFVERDDLMKWKYKIKGGHISDTLFKDYTRIIPKNVLEKKNKVQDVFDDFVIWHYFNEELEKKVEKKQKITPEEKSKMRDPILFGIIAETNRLYFIVDWIDEQCDLSFEEMVDIIGKDEKEITISREPKIE
jgi:hypothetical protein